MTDIDSGDRRMSDIAQPAFPATSRRRPGQDGQEPDVDIHALLDDEVVVMRLHDRPPDVAAVVDAATQAFRDSLARRVVDVVVAGLALVALAPLLLVIALAVRLETPGPAIFRQVRVGRGSRPFQILKFRSMAVDSAGLGPQVSGKRDPRVTRVGHLLRATKLDELPQFVNVLDGSMTLIGPRAEVPAYVAHYTPAERRALDVRPGLTGAGQVYFGREQAADLDEVADPELHYLTHQLHPKLALDLQYLRSRSPARDLRVVMDTICYLLRR